MKCLRMVMQMKALGFFLEQRALLKLSQGAGFSKCDFYKCCSFFIFFYFFLLFFTFFFRNPTSLGQIFLAQAKVWQRATYLFSSGQTVLAQAKVWQRAIDLFSSSQISLAQAKVWQRATDLLLVILAQAKVWPRANIFALAQASPFQLRLKFCREQHICSSSSQPILAQAKVAEQNFFIFLHIQLKLKVLA